MYTVRVVPQESLRLVGKCVLSERKRVNDSRVTVYVLMHVRSSWFLYNVTTTNFLFSLLITVDSSTRRSCSLIIYRLRLLIFWEVCGLPRRVRQPSRDSEMFRITNERVKCIASWKYGNAREAHICKCIYKFLGRVKRLKVNSRFTINWLEQCTRVNILEWNRGDFSRARVSPADYRCKYRFPRIQSRNQNRNKSSRYVVCVSIRFPREWIENLR